MKKGKVTGLFTDWASCREAVEGYPGALYKSFSSEEEARAFLEGRATGQAGGEGQARLQGPAEEELRRFLPTKEDTLVAYVDGSYEHSLGRYAFGCVFLTCRGEIHTEKGSGSNPESAALRNVTGEMLGAMFAVRFAMVNGFAEIELRYDYEGIEKWVTGAWRCKNSLTSKYAEAMRRWRESIRVRFTKVAAHSNVYYNEMADGLAREGLLTEDGIPEIQKIWKR